MSCAKRLCQQYVRNSKTIHMLEVVAGWLVGLFVSQCCGTLKASAARCHLGLNKIDAARPNAWSKEPRSRIVRTSP